MTDKDKNWIESSIISNRKYGFPECCINEFISMPPDEMKKNKPSFTMQSRYALAHVNNKYTGFIPCTKHACMIAVGLTTLAKLIDYNKRDDPMPFPHGQNFK